MHACLLPLYRYLYLLCFVNFLCPARACAEQRSRTTATEQRVVMHGCRAVNTQPDHKHSFFSSFQISTSALPNVIFVISWCFILFPQMNVWCHCHCQLVSALLIKLYSSFTSAKRQLLVARLRCGAIARAPKLSWASRVVVSSECYEMLSSPPPLQTWVMKH